MEKMKKGAGKKRKPERQEDQELGRRRRRGGMKVVDEVRETPHYLYRAESIRLV